MLQKIIHFVKYHNAVSIGISLVFVLSFSAMASDDIRGAVLGEKIVIEQGIDNSVLLATDLDKFDLAMQITAVSQDSEPLSVTDGDSISGDQNYYVTYIFKTLGIEDNRWQEIAREKVLTVSKVALGNEDLGIYVTKEISEVADNELAYLKEVQMAEKAKGETKVVETTDYSGLIGLVLDVKNKILPGYEPVIELPEVVVPPEPEPVPTPEPISEPIPDPEPEPTPTTTVQACQYKEPEGSPFWEVNDVVLSDPDFLYGGNCVDDENKTICQAIWCRDNQPQDACPEMEGKQESIESCPAPAQDEVPPATSETDPAPAEPPPVSEPTQEPAPEKTPAL